MIWACDFSVLGLSDTESPKIEASLHYLLQSKNIVWDDALRQRMEDSIKPALQTLGYYHAHWHWQNGCSLSVQPGPQVKIRNVDIAWSGDASKDPTMNALLRTHAMHPGDALDQSRYEDLKSAMEHLARTRGYFDGNWQQHQIVLDQKDNVADIQLVYRSGSRYRLGKVDFLHSPVRIKVLAHYVPFTPGTPYDASLLMQLNKNLLDTQYFAHVDVQASPDKAVDHVIPVVVTLQTGQRNTLAAGVGYATDIGPRVSFSWNRPLLARSGSSISVQVQYSRIQSLVQASYNIPEMGTPNSWQLQYGFQRYVIENTVTDSTLFGPQYVRMLASGWRDMTYLHWERNFYSRTDGSTATSNLLLPGISWTRSHSMGGIDPSSGFSQTYQLEGGSTAMLADANLVDIHASWRWLTTLAERNQFLTRLDSGGIWANHWDKIPPTLRFFAGGDQSIRGYGFNALGPTDASGNVLGGHYLLVGSVQYGYQLRPKWRPHIFYDAGNAYDSIHDPSRSSTGFGVSWRSPVGPITVDVGWGLHDPSRPVRLHFYMGPPL